MKKLMAVIAVVVAFAFGATLVAEAEAEAEQCPLLIKALKERVAKLSDHNYKKERAQRLIAEAQKLHDEGKPADCVQKCEEAASSLR